MVNGWPFQVYMLWSWLNRTSKKYSQEIIPAPKKGSSENVAFWKKCLLRKSICSEIYSEVTVLKKFLSLRVADQKKYLLSKSSY